MSNPTQKSMQEGANNGRKVVVKNPMESARDLVHMLVHKLQDEEGRWYAVGEIGGGHPTIATLFGLSQMEVEAVLQLAGFGVLVRKKGFQVRVDSIRNFIFQHNLGEVMEISTFQWTLTKKREHFIRLGKRFKSRIIPGQKEELRRSTRMRTLMATSNETREIVRDLLEQHGPKTSVLRSQSASQEVEQPPIQTGENVSATSGTTKKELLLNYINARLGGLEREDDIEDALLEMAGDIRVKKEKQLTDILGTETILYSPETTASAPERFPHLQAYKVPITEQRVHEGLLRDLHKLNYKKTGSTTMELDTGNNRQRSLVTIPRSKNLERFRRNDQKYDWFKNVLSAMSNDQSTDEMMKDLLSYVATHTEFRTILADVVDEMGISILPTIDEHTTFAIQSSANRTYQQMRELRRYLRVVLGHNLFSSEFKIKQMCGGSNFIVPTTGVLQYERQKIPWSCRDVDTILINYCSQLYKASWRDGGGDRVKGLQALFHIDLIVVIDHGKGFSRATLILVFRYRFEDGSLQEDEEVFALASAKCRKDNYEIVRDTCGRQINEALKRIKQAGSVLCFKHDGTLTLGEQGGNETVLTTKAVPIEMWVAGDLLFYALALGKEGAASFWCAYCNLSHRQWQQRDHEDGVMWTLGNLSEHRQQLLSGELKWKDAHDRKGLKEDCEVLFESIDVDHFVVCTLHLQIGAVNQIYENLMVEAQAGCEIYSNGYLQASEALEKARNEWEEARSDLADFERTHVQYERDLKRDTRSATGDLREMMEIELTEIKEERKYFQEKKRKLKEVKDKAADAFEGEANKPENSKQIGQPVRAMIEDVLTRFHISRGAYHGGDIQGNGCRLLMTKNVEIIGEIRDLLLGLPEGQKRVTDDDIVQMLQVHERVLGHLDGLFAILRKKRFHVTEEDVGKAMRHRDHTLAIWRYLGKSVTPKLHLIEAHAIDLLNRCGGFGDLGEDAGERAHQVEARNESRVAAVKSLENKEITKCQFEAMRKNLDVKRVSVKMEKDSKRKFIKRAATSSSKRRKEEKSERDRKRDELLALPMMVGTMESLRKKRWPVASL